MTIKTVLIAKLVVSRPGLGLESDQDRIFKGLDLGLGLGTPGLGLGLDLGTRGLGLGIGTLGFGDGLGLGLLISVSVLVLANVVLIPTLFNGKLIIFMFTCYTMNRKYF